MNWWPLRGRCQLLFHLPNQQRQTGITVLPSGKNNHWSAQRIERRSNLPQSSASTNHSCCRRGINQTLQKDRIPLPRAHDNRRPQLKGQITGDFRPCFRTTAKNRLNHIDSTDVKKALKDEREPRFLEHYLQKTDPEAKHRRVTGGQFLESVARSSRTEATTLHRLLLDRHIPLRATKATTKATRNTNRKHCTED